MTQTNISQEILDTVEACVEPYRLVPNKRFQHTVMLIDDDPDHLAVFSALLNANGYNVITANNGIEAEKQLQTTLCHVIVSDVMMPGISGIEFASWLKSSQRLKEIPIILLSASKDDAADLVLSMDGPDMFCNKREAMRLLPAQVEFLLS